LRYYVESSKVGTFNEFEYVDFYYTIRNGFPGVIVETDQSAWKVEEEIGFYWDAYYDYGSGATYQFLFMPEDQLFNTDVDIGVAAVNATEIDDNWAIIFNSPDDSNAPSKDGILGMVTDGIHDGLGSGDLFEITNASSIYSHGFTQGFKHGAFFFVPYDVDLLYFDAYGFTDGAVPGSQQLAAVDPPTTETGLGTYVLNAQNEEGFWNAGTLAKGTYMAYWRVYYDENPLSGANNYDFYVEINGGAVRVANTNNSYNADAWYEVFLPFHVDGSTNVDIGVKQTTADPFTAVMYIDYTLVIPVSNAVDYPADLAHQAMRDVQISRGLKR
jgi:hypothetical protein